MQPFDTLFIQLTSGPGDHAGRKWLEIIKAFIVGAVVIMISANGYAPKVTENLNTLNRTGIISDNISNADKIRYPFVACIINNCV
jgi:hypothetical protein